MSRLLEPWPLLAAHGALTIFMVGLIWFVQIVHYPLFEEVGRDQFSRYEQLHVRRVGWVVGPVMLVEAATALVLVAMWPAQPHKPLLWANLVLLALIWISTAIWQVPQHEVLQSGFQPDAARFLVASNWVRTICWSLRGALLAWMLATRAAPQ